VHDFPTSCGQNTPQCCISACWRRQPAAIRKTKRLGEVAVLGSPSESDI
jgi:hypothetical protein